MDNLTRNTISDMEQMFSNLKEFYEKTGNQQFYEIKQEKENYKVENNTLKQKIIRLETELSKNRESRNLQTREIQNLTETLQLLQSNRKESLKEIQNELSSTETLSKTRYEVRSNAVTTILCLLL
jgi:predicted nuclease with TOPRIM domain